MHGCVQLANQCFPQTHTRVPNTPAPAPCHHTEEDVLRAIVALWQPRRAAIQARTLEIMAGLEAAASAGAAGGSEAEAGEELLAELRHLQLVFALLFGTFHIAIFGLALTDVQHASLVVLSWPYIPNLVSIEQALMKYDQERGAPPAAGEASAGAGAGGAS